MRGWGWGFMLVGMALVGFSFVYDVSAGSSLYGRATANLDLMSVRQMIHQTGAAFGVIGAIFLAASHLMGERPAQVQPKPASSSADIFRDQVGLGERDQVAARQDHSDVQVGIDLSRGVY